MWKYLLIVAWLTASISLAADTNTVEEESVWTQHVLDSYRALSEQQQATLRAVEEARAEAEANAKRQTDALEARLKQLEGAVSAQRDRQVEALETSQRYTLKIVSFFAGSALIGVLIFALILLRAMNRRTAMVHVQPAGGLTGLTALDPAQQSGARLRSSLDRLETRLADLETTTQPPLTDAGARTALLLGKGQALQNLQQSETALACYDEIITLDPDNAEAFVKKGAALETLGRLDDAIECYDRAIALDTSMTMAYLGKGAVFNRQERYTEALQCYEQALRAQQKASA